MLKLYWVTTEDHDEDWFVIATGESQAEEYFADYEGYDPEDPEATFVIDIPAELADGINPPEHPTDELLVALGGERLPRQTDELEAMRAVMGSGGRIFRFGGKVYAEGDIIANVARTEAN